MITLIYLQPLIHKLVIVLKKNILYSVIIF